MGEEQRTYSEDFKAKVALEALSGVKTIAQLATEFKVDPDVIIQWRTQLTSNAEKLFANGKKAHPPSKEELTKPLHDEIERLKMDISWLKNKL